MEGPLRLLLLAALLAAPLPAAAARPATFGTQPGAPCEPTVLATQVSLFCAPDMPTAQCCEPVVAAVNLGGGVPCLCRVASEPQLVMAGLNATHLLTLYTSCGGLRPGGAHLAATCEGPALPAAADVSSTPPSPAALALTMHANTCDSAHMAGQLVDSCDHAGDTPSWLCCQLAYAVVERSCLCLVSEEAQVRTSASLGRSKILFLYELCGNTKQIGKDDCGPVAPPPPPAQEPVIPPPAQHTRLGVILGCSIGGGFALIGVAYGLYKLVLWLRSRGYLGGQPPVNSRKAAEMRADAAEARLANAQATSGAAC